MKKKKDWKLRQLIKFNDWKIVISLTGIYSAISGYYCDAYDRNNIYDKLIQRLQINCRHVAIEAESAAMKDETEKLCGSFRISFHVSLVKCMCIFSTFLPLKPPFAATIESLLIPQSVKSFGR